MSHLFGYGIAKCINMKTAKITLDSIKDYGWASLAHELRFEKFKEEHPDLGEDELSDKFNEEVIYKKFEWGEFANLEIIFDEDFNIVGGKLL